MKETTHKKGQMQIEEDQEHKGKDETNEKQDMAHDK